MLERITVERECSKVTVSLLYLDDTNDIYTFINIQAHSIRVRVGPTLSS